MRSNLIKGVGHQPNTIAGGYDMISTIKINQLVASDTAYIDCRDIMLYMNMFASDFRIVNSRQILYVYIRSSIE